MRFIHIADVHLDTPFGSRSEAMGVRLRSAALEALDRCVDTAISEQVDAVLIAGDLFDGTRLSFGTERSLLTRLVRLADEGIQVVYATGNHDPGDGTRTGSLDWPDNVTVISTPAAVSVPIAPGGGEPIGHVTGAGHGTSRETADLSRLLTPVPDDDLPQVALLHTQVLSASATGRHGPYAPSTLDNLRAARFHYWALGHVHLRQELSSDPHVHYCGSLQGRTPAETGAKGGLLVDLGDPAHPVVEFRPFSPVRWERLSVSTLGEARSLEAVVAEVAGAWEAAREEDRGEEGTEWIVAVELLGPSPMWRQLREAAEAETIADEVAARLGACGVEVRAAKVHPPVRVRDHQERRDVLGATLQLAREVAEGTDTLGVTEEDLAGFDGERHGTISAYLERLLQGGSEEVLARMLDEERAE